MRQVRDGSGTRWSRPRSVGVSVACGCRRYGVQRRLFTRRARVGRGVAGGRVRARSQRRRRRPGGDCPRRCGAIFWIGSVTGCSGSVPTPGPTAGSSAITGGPAASARRYSSSTMATNRRPRRFVAPEATQAPRAVSQYRLAGSPWNIPCNMSRSQGSEISPTLYPIDPVGEHEVGVYVPPLCHRVL